MHSLKTNLCIWDLGDFKSTIAYSIPAECEFEVATAGSINKLIWRRYYFLYNQFAKTETFFEKSGVQYSLFDPPNLDLDDWEWNYYALALGGQKEL